MATQKSSGTLNVTSGFRLDGRSSSAMEIVALVEALRRVPTGAHAIVRMDALTVLQAARRRRRGSRLPRSAQEDRLWVAFDAEAARLHRLDFHWIRAHAGDPGNWKADHFAVGARRVGEAGWAAHTDGAGVVVGS